MLIFLLTFCSDFFFIHLFKFIRFGLDANLKKNTHTHIQNSHKYTSLLLEKKNNNMKTNIFYMSYSLLRPKEKKRHGLFEMKQKKK